MKAVFEEMNGDIAVFLIDNIQKTYHLSISELPPDATTGDVFEVEIETDEKLKLLRKLPEERTRRMEAAKAKREALLKRSQNKKR